MSASRMDKYDYTPAEGMSRTKRNQDIYNSTDISDISRLKTNNNVSVISDAKKEIDLEKIKRYINAMNDEEDLPLIKNELIDGASTSINDELDKLLDIKWSIEDKDEECK